MMLHGLLCFLAYGWDVEEVIRGCSISEFCKGFYEGTALVLVLVDVSYRHTSVSWPHTDFMDICPNLDQ